MFAYMSATTIQEIKLKKKKSADSQSNKNCKEPKKHTSYKMFKNLMEKLIELY